MDLPVEERLRGFIVANFLFGDLSRPLGYDDSFLEMGIIDSTGIIELVTFLQDSFGISVKNEELVPENLDTIRRLVNFLRQKKSCPPQSS